MSTSVFPALPGLAFPVERVPLWSTITHEATSGKETRVARRSAPRWQWTVSFDVLRSDVSYHEMQDLAGFFNSRRGMFDSFLYADADDNAVTAQQIGTGDGVASTFQLLRTFGSFIESVLAPNVVSAVYLDGVAQTVTVDYAVSVWGAVAPGVVTFVTPPAGGVVVTADFSYYFPVRFTDDEMNLVLFMSKLYELKKLCFISLK